MGKCVQQEILRSIPESEGIDCEFGVLTTCGTLCNHQCGHNVAADRRRARQQVFPVQVLDCASRHSALAGLLGRTEIQPTCEAKFLENSYPLRSTIPPEATTSFMVCKYRVDGQLDGFTRVDSPRDVSWALESPRKSLTLPPREIFCTDRSVPGDWQGQWASAYRHK